MAVYLASTAIAPPNHSKIRSTITFIAHTSFLLFEPPTSKFLDAQDSLSKIGSVVDVGNPEVGAILQHYAQQANDLTVPLDLSVWVPQTLNINILDLSIIIGNTFENALEACLALPAQHRKISLEISVHNNLLLYEMSNPYIEGGKHRLHSGHSFHGYGIQNVQSVVDKYGGTLDIKQEGGMFRITLYLNLNPS